MVYIITVSSILALGLTAAELFGDDTVLARKPLTREAKAQLLMDLASAGASFVVCGYGAFAVTGDIVAKGGHVYVFYILFSLLTLSTWFVAGMKIYTLYERREQKDWQAEIGFAAFVGVVLPLVLFLAVDNLNEVVQAGGDGTEGLTAKEIAQEPTEKSPLNKGAAKDSQKEKKKNKSSADVDEEIGVDNEGDRKDGSKTKKKKSKSGADEEMGGELDDDVKELWKRSEEYIDDPSATSPADEYTGVVFDEIGVVEDEQLDTDVDPEKAVASVGKEVSQDPEP